VVSVTKFASAGSSWHTRFPDVCSGSCPVSQSRDKRQRSISPNLVKTGFACTFWGGAKITNFPRDEWEFSSFARCITSPHQEIYGRIALLDHDEPIKSLRGFMEWEMRRCYRKRMLCRYTKTPLMPQTTCKRITKACNRITRG